jgi:uncharacterized UPF0146 family protein
MYIFIGPPGLKYSVSVSDADTLVGRLSDYERVVEVGIGHRSDVAGALANRGVSVTATDVESRETPPEVEFVRDDVTDPDRRVYAGADAIYARNFPRELHSSALALAEAVDAALRFTTLGAEQPAVQARPVTLERGTLFIAR